MWITPYGCRDSPLPWELSRTTTLSLTPRHIFHCQQPSLFPLQTGLIIPAQTVHDGKRDIPIVKLTSTPEPAAAMDHVQEPPLTTRPEPTTRSILKSAPRGQSSSEQVEKPCLIHLTTKLVPTRELTVRNLLDGSVPSCYLPTLLSSLSPLIPSNPLYSSVQLMPHLWLHPVPRTHLLCWYITVSRLCPRR